MIWPILGVLSATGLMIWVEVPGLWKKQQFKELLIFSVLLIMGTSLGIAQAAKIEIASPLDWISYVFEPVGEWILRMLK
ncbi:hypothetical protein [Paenibacillus agricola]|uniref:Uncharacterized protein n=1 Tax=Paenibacillus agricola TaxID=2716264 RepID=A0ABX0J935_9BACL|nr:hypothetical protein [Paenibacillus agricola]NHN30669.1 hypothetical protein [Paenibacillus agricola]